MSTGNNPIQDNEYVRTVSSIGQAMARGDAKRAYELADWAVGRGMGGRVIYNARGFGLQASGRHVEAIENFRKALEAAPKDAATLNAIGLSELALQRFHLAQAAFEGAIEFDPNNAIAHYRLGLALAQLGDHVRARECHEKALALRPSFPEASAALAAIAARTRKPDEAREHAERALAVDPNASLASYALVVLDMNERRFEDAERKLKTMLAATNLKVEARANALSLLGDALDGQGRYAEAFEIYRQGNLLLRNQSRQRFEDERGINTIGYMTAYFEKADRSKWRLMDDAYADPDGPAEHVFLLGFMRSGTTLLEQVLSSNPKVVALEEKTLLATLSVEYATSVEGLDALAALDGEDLARARAEYWTRARTYAPDLNGRIFVDKQPLNTLRLCLIAKLFPKAKILFALRDPRDVVFSCYRRHFRVNMAMFEFLDLEDAARFYASVMNLGQIYRDLLPLNLLEHRYEDMVRDFEGRVRAVCEFIGLEWSDSMREFHKNAPSPDIRSPSAGQVQRPLYGEGVGQWRLYSQQLTPMLPILAPWVRRFGYSEE